MDCYDVVIVGASFSGLTLAHHLPRHCRVLVVDAKPAAGSSVESTGLITQATRREFTSFFPIDDYITNPMTAICVVAPDFRDHFLSHTGEPWIFQTDTKALVRALAETVPPNVEVRTSTVFQGVNDPSRVTAACLQTKGRAPEDIGTRFLVGADGSHSKVASVIPELSRNSRFLFGHEHVLFGNVHLGLHPEQTIYHFWFGEFSLGYGGWLSPTSVDGRSAIRVGLAKLKEDRADASRLLNRFIDILKNRGIITVEAEIDKPGYVFGSLIPINGPLKNISHGNTLLVGDAAGFCGAFAADGIKGSVVSGKEAAPLISAYLHGDMKAPARLKKQVDLHGGLLEYYSRQLRYRFIWDLMKRDRSFRAMYDVIEREKDTFLHQFCDSKDRRRSLTRTVLKTRHLPQLTRYAAYLFFDAVFK